MLWLYLTHRDSQNQGWPKLTLNAVAVMRKKTVIFQHDSFHFLRRSSCLPVSLSFSVLPNMILRPRGCGRRGQAHRLLI